MKQRLRPQSLRKGAKVGLVSPSAPMAALAPHRLEACTRSLESLGYGYKLGACATAIDGYVSASAVTRAADIHTFLEDPEVGAILCLIGGYHFNHLLPHLDLDLFRKYPKPIIGYSDATILLVALYQATGLITFYGPAGLTQFGEYPHPLPYSVTNLFRALTSRAVLGRIEPSEEWTEETLNWLAKEDLTRPRTLLPNAGPVCMRTGLAEGVLLGGCLSSLVRLRGTSFWPDFSGALLFLETPEGHDFTKGQDLRILDAELMDLANSGVFSQVSGVLVGRPFGMSGSDKRAFLDMIVAHTAGRGIPILADLDFGHTDPMMTIPLGVRGRIIAEECSFEILESPTE